MPGRDGASLCTSAARGDEIALCRRRMEARSVEQSEWQILAPLRSHATCVVTEPALQTEAVGTPVPASLFCPPGAGRDRLLTAQVRVPADPRAKER